MRDLLFAGALVLAVCVFTSAALVIGVWSP